MDLVILAAGMGSRFGGLKQIEPVDEYNNFIIDYSVYDAIRAGFDRIVFIIKEENYQIFKDTIGKRIEDKIEVKYAFQTLDLIPEGIKLPEGRVKPLGTAQALLSIKGIVKGSFAIINADDFYGYESFEIAAKYLKSLPEGTKNQYANVGYQVANTMTENGSVKRGVLLFDENGNLNTLVESVIEKIDGKIIATPLADKNTHNEITAETLVSMNMFAFTNDVLDYLEERYEEFFKNNMDNLETCEYLLPTVIDTLIHENRVSVKILDSTAVWYGVTYKEDKEFVVSSLKKLVDSNKYKKGLW